MNLFFCFCYVFFYLFNHLSTYIFFYLSIFLHFYHFIYFSVYLSLYLSFMYLSVCIYLLFFLYLSIYLCIMCLSLFYLSANESVVVFIFLICPLSPIFSTSLSLCLVIYTISFHLSFSNYVSITLCCMYLFI